MGATVYKIETIKGNLHRGDGVGFGMPELGPDNPAFDMSNANKKFLSIDMKSDGGRELVEKLLEQADVFVTSLRNPSLSAWATTTKHCMPVTRAWYTAKCAAMENAAK